MMQRITNRVRQPIRTTTLCQLGHIAIQVGRKLKWDPVAERFPDDPEANRLLTRFMRAPWQL